MRHIVLVCAILNVERLTGLVRGQPAVQLDNLGLVARFI